MTTRIGEDIRARVNTAWADILAKIAAGAHIGDTLQAAGLTREHMRAYLSTTPDARQQWQDARVDSADAFFDQALAIANNMKVDPKRARVQLAAVQWLAAMRNPRVYGMKQQLDVNVRTVDLTAIILAANARLAAAREPLTIEGEIVRPLLTDIL